MLFACSVISCRYRVRWRGSSSMILQRLEKSGDDRQRRLELVRDVGDEIAAHARHGFDLRDVAADQQALLDAERHDLDRQRRPRLALRVDDQRSR